MSFVRSLAAKNAPQLHEPHAEDDGPFEETYRSWYTQAADPHADDDCRGLSDGSEVVLFV